MDVRGFLEGRTEEEPDEVDSDRLGLLTTGSGGSGSLGQDVGGGFVLEAEIDDLSCGRPYGAGDAGMWDGGAGKVDNLESKELDPRDGAGGKESGGGLLACVVISRQFVSCDQPKKTKTYDAVIEVDLAASTTNKV